MHKLKVITACLGLVCLFTAPMPALSQSRIIEANYTIFDQSCQTQTDLGVLDVLAGATGAVLRLGILYSAPTGSVPSVLAVMNRVPDPNPYPISECEVASSELYYKDINRNNQYDPDVDHARMRRHDCESIGTVPRSYFQVQSGAGSVGPIFCAIDNY